MHYRAHQRAIPGARDLPLDGHQAALAVVHDEAAHFAIQGATGAGVFVGIGENTQVVEPGSLHEPAQFFEIFGRLARKSGDEAGADGHPGDGPANALQQFQKDTARPAALHALQDAGARVLQRNVDVLHQRRMRGHGVQQPLRDPVGVGVEEADPFFAGSFNLGQAFEKVGQPIGDAQVFAVRGGVLPDQINLADALLEKARGFGNDGFQLAAAEMAAILRDHAEGARMVAAFRDFDVSEMARS